MRRITITKKNLKDYAEMVPAELYDGIAAGSISAIGMKFSGMEAGAVVWSDIPGDDYGRLISLFVPPEFRGLDVGHNLLQEAIFDMGAAKKKGITFRYEDAGERRTLTPFFNIFGFRTDVTETPLGRITLNEALEKIESAFGSIEPMGVSIRTLSADERRIVSDHISQLDGANPRQYLDSDTDSFIILDKEKVKGLLLFSREEPDLLSLDYFFSQTPKHLAGLLKLALRELLNTYSLETPVEMLLSTQEGLKLYKGLFGEPHYNVRIAECRQSFKQY